MDAAIILAKCSRTGKSFGIRIQRQGETHLWHETWAFPVEESVAAREGFDQPPMDVSLTIDAGFPGCPHCGKSSQCFCGRCGKPTCWNGEPDLTCAWCGMEMHNLAAGDVGECTFHITPGSDR